MSLTMPRRSASYRPAVDPARWPAVAARPPRGLRSHIAKRLFLRVARRLDVRILLPDGQNVGGGGPDAPLMRLDDPAAFYGRVGAGGLIGFGEAYMAGDWTADDLAGVLTVFCGRMATLVPPPLQRLRDVAVHRHPKAERQTAENSPSNVSRHYDLSNDLFALFLDETLTYSSALFGPGEGCEDAAATAGFADLAAAQRRKIDRLLDAVGVGPGSRVLEIGTGWGELAIRAARRGAHVRSLTLSEEQRVLALRRVAAAGVADRVEIDLCDYRAATGTYDAVVSVEMVEAVGFDFWGEYFATLDRLVAPGGRVGLQAITMPHDRMLAARDTYTWIHKYVFPGGCIPSAQSVRACATAHTSMDIIDSHAFGLHYAQTVRLWREAFTEVSGEVDALGFDSTFRRMWTFYLAYSEAGFRSRYLDVYQFVLQKGSPA